MKETINFILMTMVVLLAACRQQGAVEKEETKPHIIFLTEMTHNFGAVSSPDTVTFDFVYRNEGPGGFAIDNVKPGCSCTIASYSRDTIAPGETDTLRVGLKLREISEGFFSKRVEIFSNADTTLQVRIRGTYVRNDVPNEE